MKKSLEELIVALIENQEDQHADTDRRLDNIEKVMISQEINLKDHMRRSDNLEKLVNVLQEKHDLELKPLNRHVSMVEGAFKLLGVLALIVTIITGLSKIFGAI